MNFNILEFINHKKNKCSHTQQDIAQFIQLVQSQQIADYQIAA